jgi:hypothetical protein
MTALNKWADLLEQIVSGRKQPKRKLKTGHAPLTPGRGLTGSKAKAVAENTPRCRYNEEARVKLKRHIEQVVARRGIHCEIDWGTLWGAIEEAARIYTWNEESPSSKACSPADTIAGLVECAELINALLRKLNNHELFNWNFISDSTDPWCRSIKRETLKFDDLIEQLADVRAKVTADAKGLQELAAEQKIRAYRKDDCIAELKGRLLEIGQNLFGPQVGGSDGPLITFLQLALRPILGEATPDADALRAFARRHTT